MKITRKVLVSEAACLIVGLTFVLPSATQAQLGIARPPRPATAASVRVSGPYRFKNLSVFLIHGKETQNGAHFMTLQEALKKKAVTVKETGDVNRLTIQNKSNSRVFIQSGEILKGGQQDRAIQHDMILPPKSSVIPLNVFCVEQGRWEQRGHERADQFASSGQNIASKELKQAAYAGDQSAVWSEVSKLQNKAQGTLIASAAPHAAHGLAAPPPPVLAAAAMVAAAPPPLHEVQVVNGSQSTYQSVPVGYENPYTNPYSTPIAVMSVTGAASPTSLELTLENENVQKNTKPYVDNLLALANKDSDVIGYAFAINGKVNSADVYGSNELFKKLWPKMLNASAMESFANSDKSKDSPSPKTEEISALISDAENAKVARRESSGQARLLTRQSSKNELFETLDDKSEGATIHKNYMTRF